MLGLLPRPADVPPTIFGEFMSVDESVYLSVPALARHLSALYATGPEGIIFDCDGVLVDSSTANIYYYNLLREGVGLPPISPEQERYVHMSTSQQAIEAIIPPALRPALREVTRRISYQRDIQPLMTPSEGLIDFLDLCKSRDMLLAVHTNRQNGMASFLEQCGLSSYFDPVVTAAMAPPKPDPEGTRYILRNWNMPPQKLLFVGDSSTDKDAAEGAQVPFLAFRALGLSPHGYCNSFQDLRTAMQQLWAKADRGD